MGEKTNIGWTDATWNPATGCSKVSDGCSHCYAETLSLRMGWSEKPWAAAYAKENVVLHPDRLELPLKWKKPRMVFVNSMSDLFHEVIPEDFIHDVFEIMAITPQHTYQVLTKRPERMRDLMISFQAAGKQNGNAMQFPLPNVWLGTSVEAQREADLRIPFLLDTPAAVRFLSCEPLLGPLNLHEYLWEEAGPDWAGANLREPGLDWIICGGESGSHLALPENKHRWMNLDWARWLGVQCQTARVPFYFKQQSAIRPGQKSWIPDTDGSEIVSHEFPGHYDEILAEIGATP